MKTFFKNIAYPVCFLLGVFFSFLITPAFSIAKILAWGIEIQSAESFPMGHTAKIRTRPGFGDQTIFFEVDGRDVWQSGDAAPGDLNEKIVWDKIGRYVTFEFCKNEFDGKMIFAYDLETKSEVKRNEKSIQPCN
ncbi:MAG TPA: hypothetical protein PKY82_35430 [Pyrinomonadaceae bacterium]|nr:hypothetical protein [Pyrinomonadaceae bacterium]